MKLKFVFSFLIVVLTMVYFFRPQVAKEKELTTSKKEEVISVVKSPAGQYSTNDKKARTLVKPADSALKIEPSKSEESKNSLYQAMKLYGKDKKQAAELLKKAIELDPSNLLAHGRYSGLLMGQGRLKEAREIAKKCLAIDPSDSICNRAMVSSFTQHGEFEEAYQHILDCLDNNPENVHCLGGMVSTLLSMKDVEAAEELVAYLEELQVEDIWLSLAKAQYYQSVGENVAALENYRVACKKGQPFACRMVKEISESI